MNKFLVVLFLFWNVSAHAVCDPTTMASLGVTTDLTRVTTISPVLDQIYAVHAGTYIPIDGFLRPHLGLNDLDPVIHWALGELVPPIDENSTWENSKFAIIAPLKEVLPQVLNFMANDTYTLGNTKLTTDDWIVAPQGTVHGVPQAKLVEFDPKTTTLRQAIENAISQRGGLVLTLRSTPGTPFYTGGESTDFVTFKNLWAKNPQPSNIPDVNTFDFFAPLLKQVPGSSFGTHNRTIVGDNGRLGQIDYSTQFVTGGWSGGQALSTDAEGLIRAFLEVNSAKLDEKISNLQTTPDQKQVYANYRHEIDGFKNLMDADLELRNATGKSFFNGASPTQQSALMGARFTPAQIQDLVQKNASSWGAISQTPFSDPFKSLSMENINIRSLTFDDIPALATAIQKFLPGFLEIRGGEAALKLLWANNRLQMLQGLGNEGIPMINSENLPQIIEAASVDFNTWIKGRPATEQDDDGFALRLLRQNYDSWKMRHN